MPRVLRNPRNDKITMKIQITRIDQTLPLPEYQTAGAVCFDLLARETTTIEAGKIALIPCNIIVKVPEGYLFMLANRSSTAMKKGLIMGNGIGIVDQDYCGPTDEVKYQAFNITDGSVTIERGDRVVQGCFMPVTKVEFEEVASISTTDRGGFGSTGHK